MVELRTRLYPGAIEIPQKKTKFKKREKEMLVFVHKNFENVIDEEDIAAHAKQNS